MMWNEYMLGLHIKYKSTKAKLHDNDANIAITYFLKEDMGTISRSMKHKGYETFIAIRKVSDEERDSEIPIVNYRVRWTKYESWESLISDEKKFTLEDGWLNKLEELRKEYKKLDVKVIQNQIKFKEDV